MMTIVTCLLAIAVLVRGAVVQYELVVRWGSQVVDAALPSDGVVLVNGQFPAPTLRAVAGDEMQVTVRNQLNESTTVHFHGILQRGTPAMDGVPFGTQCPIAPGANFTYRFVADAPGTFWYHAHVDNHFVRGFAGALLVRSAADQSEQQPELVWMFSDWYHTPTDELMRQMMASKPHTAPTPDALLVNGVGGANSARVPVQANTTYRVHLINAAAISFFRVTVDGHNVTIVGADAARVMPFATPFVDIDAGQRYEVLLHTSDTNGTFDVMVESLHRVAPPAMARAQLIVGDALAGTRKRQHDGHGGHGAPSPQGNNDDVAPTFESQLMGVASGALPAATTKLDISVQFDAASGQWRINDIAMLMTPMTPLLHSAVDGSPWPKSVHSVPLKRGDVVDITWRNMRDANGESEHHPMHIHGHRFWLLGSGAGGQPSLNLLRNDSTMPLERDTFQLNHGDGWAITRFVADNPGVWMAHCHYTWHMSSGMAFFFRYERNSLPFLAADTKRCAVALPTDSGAHLQASALVVAVLALMKLII